MSPSLFSPLEIRGVRLKNRIAVTPMAQYSGVDGMPTDTHTVHLGRLAEGGAGLVIQEGTAVDRRGRGTYADLGIWDDSMVPRYKRLVDVIKSNGAVPGIQLFHAGRKVHRNPPWGAGESAPTVDDFDVVGPSAVAAGGPGMSVPRELSASEIAETVESWVNAARRAHEAGYEVLEVMAAHGYLIHTFLSPLSNHRTDGYGGSLENRSRLLTEIIDGIRTVWPTDKALFVRLSTVDEEWGIGQTVELVRELQKHEVDLIDCSSGGLTGLPPRGAARYSYGYQVPYAQEVRARTGIKTMAVGYIIHPTQADSIIENAQADLVAMGRELLYNPNWPIDAARKLGAAEPNSLAPQRISYWLNKRDHSFPDYTPSTEGDLCAREDSDSKRVR